MSTTSWRNIVQSIANWTASPTALHLAALDGDLRRLKHLVELIGYNPNLRITNFGWTPLLLASRKGHQAIVEYLIDIKQCDPNCRDCKGRSPLHHACWRGHLTVVKYLIDSKQCDPNCRDYKGRTPLHLACREGQQDTVEYLIDNKQCDPNCRDDRGQTPLHQASLGHQAIVEYLIINKQCDPNCRDSAGVTPLHIASGKDNQATVKYLIDSKHCDFNSRDNDGQTSLHFACLNNCYQVTCYLLTKCDPNTATNSGQTPLSLTTDIALIRELIKFGAQAKIAYRKYLPGSYSKEPASSVVKTFILGDPEAGKTTLTEAIKSESSGIFSNLSGRFKRVLKTNERTVGIVPHNFESNHFGSVFLYDFAGQREFYASHDALLQSSFPGETAVYIIVVDLAKSNEEFQAILLYWLSFICKRRSSKTQHVIIVGSHADLVSSKEDMSQKESIIKFLCSSESFKCLNFVGFTAVDCRYAQSAAMTQLRRCLRQSYEELRPIAMLELKTHCFFLYLLEKSGSIPAISLSSVMATIEAEENKELVAYFPHDTGHLVAMCEELSVRGNILFFSNPSNPAESMLVLDQRTLFTRVTGTIFAPEHFKQHSPLASSTGVVPFTKLTSQFPDLDSNMITQFMCHLEFCREISDPKVLQLLQDSSDSIDEERKFFFFPGLVSIKAPTKVWEQTGRAAYCSGWLLQCTQPEQFFSPRFLQVLLLRLVFSFALTPFPGNFVPPSTYSAKIPSICRRCIIWKNGIYWATGYGVEALVEVSTDSKRVTVMISGAKGYLPAAAKLRSGVICKVLQAKMDLCATISCHESLLDSSTSSIYPPRINCTIGIPMSAVAEAIVHAEPFIVLDSGKIQLDELLSFESYAALGTALLGELFDGEKQSYNEPLKDEFIYRIARKAFPFINMFIEMLNLEYPDMLDNLTDQGRNGTIHQLARAIQIWRGDYRTICHLREKLDQFSVFAGRNPLTIAL